MHPLAGPIIEFEGKKLCGSFLLMGFNCLKARAT